MDLRLLSRDHRLYLVAKAIGVDPLVLIIVVALTRGYTKVRQIFAAHNIYKRQSLLALSLPFVDSAVELIDLFRYVLLHDAT